MKPEFERIQKKSSDSFSTRVIKRDQRPLLSEAWHFHPEIEICYTHKSHGLRYVGNNISEYLEHDLVIFGSYLPHGFTTTNQSEQYVIQFTHDFLGKEFLESYEFEDVKLFLNRSSQGILITGSEVSLAEDYIQHLFQPSTSKISRLLRLLELLNYLAKCTSYELICTDRYSASLNETKLQKVKTILQYIHDNYHQDITIQSAARAVNMTESAFYKFIKRHTNKKFTTIVNEYRINHASQLLVSGDLPITDVSYQSGYNNLSYFNRVFLKTYQMTPRQFRDGYQN